LYVVNGKLYRELTAIDFNYEQQYNWLKSNVFGGVEYATGSRHCIQNDRPWWDYRSDSLPANVTDTLEYNHVHENTSYESPVFSLARHVERLREPTGPVVDKIMGVRVSGKIVRIVGTGFGETQGDGVVHIGKRTYGVDSPRIKLWTDTKVRIRLPRFACKWFKGKDFKRAKVWVTVNEVDSNLKKPKVIKPDTCPDIF